MPFVLESFTLRVLAWLSLVFCSYMLSAWSDLCHIAAFHSNKEQEWLMVVIKLFYFTNILIGVPLFLFWVLTAGPYLQGNPPPNSQFFFVFYSSLFSKVNTTAHWVLINCHYWSLRLLWLRRLSFVMVKSLVSLEDGVKFKKVTTNVTGKAPSTISQRNYLFPLFEAA